MDEPQCVLPGVFLDFWLIEFSSIEAAVILVLMLFLLTNKLCFFYTKCSNN